MSAVEPQAKQTKKQKKAAAFRNRQKDGHGKRKERESQALPEQDLEDEDGDDVLLHSIGPESGNIGKESKKLHDAGVSKKRKRDSQDIDDTAASGTVNEAGKAATSRKRGKKDPEAENKKQRFILFVGNLKYTTSIEAIQKHFAACDPPPTVRLLTPKASQSGRISIKSKGCAFLEFTHRNALQQGLRLHQSEIEGRRINVELTAGGGGKGEERLKKVRERNKELGSQREKKRSSKTGQDSVEADVERPQRYSATSGLEQALVKKRTWTVGEQVEDDATHRGGVKHRKERGKRKGKEWGTGVNAIPVG